MASRKANSKGAALFIVIFFAAVAGAVSLPFLGARYLVRGYERDLAETIFLTFLVNLVLIGAGLWLGTLVFPIVISMLNSQASTAATQDDAAMKLGLSLLITLVCCAGGLLFGWMERPARMEAFSVARDNRAFLAQHGIAVTGREDVTHYDSSQHPLRYMEADGNRMVFMAVGRRNRRAYIDLDATGRMTRYSGIVSL